MTIVSVGTINPIMLAGDWSVSGRHVVTCTKAVEETRMLKFR